MGCWINSALVPICFIDNRVCVLMSNDKGTSHEFANDIAQTPKEY